MWKVKNLSTDGNNLTNVNFAMLDNQIKFAVSQNYHQQSLAQLVSTITPEERASMRNQQNNSYVLATISVTFRAL